MNESVSSCFLIHYIYNIHSAVVKPDDVRAGALVAEPFVCLTTLDTPHPCHEHLLPEEEPACYFHF